MRIDLKALSLLLVVGCGGGGGTDTTTLPAPAPEEPTPMAENPPPAEPTTPAEPAAPAEPVKPVIPDAPTAGPDIYKAVFENDKVRVFEITFAPGAKIAMHQHPDHAIYALTAGTLKITTESGETKDMTLKKGDAGFFPGESHSAENATDKEVKAVLVELKPGAAFTAAPKAGDPLKVGKNIYKKVFENDRVRILTINFKKGASIKAHSHPDHVVFITSAGTLKISPAEGEPQEMALEVGQAVMLDAGIHSAKNIKGNPQAVVFELKPVAH
jgi:quercetin dioxygenase-like cupin family protein